MFDLADSYISVKSSTTDFPLAVHGHVAAVSQIDQLMLRDGHVLGNTFYCHAVFSICLTRCTSH